MLNNSYVMLVDCIVVLNVLDGCIVDGIIVLVGQIYVQFLVKGGINIVDYIFIGSLCKLYKSVIVLWLGVFYDVFGNKVIVVYGGWGCSYDCCMVNNVLDELQKNVVLGGEIWLICNKFKMLFVDQMSLGVCQVIGDWNMDLVVFNIYVKNQFFWFSGNWDLNGGFGNFNNVDLLWGGVFCGYGFVVFGDFVGENKFISVFLLLEKFYMQVSGWSMMVVYMYIDVKMINNEWLDDIFDWIYGKVNYGFYLSKDVEKNCLVVGGFYDKMFWGFQFFGKLILGDGQLWCVVDCYMGFIGFIGCIVVFCGFDFFKQFDLVLVKNIKVYGGELQICVDVFNLFNIVNWGFYDDWVGGVVMFLQNVFGGDNVYFDIKIGVCGLMWQFKFGVSYLF